jgi:hypothetical protein
MYRQCSLRRGTTRQVAWVPAEFARAGRYLRIRDEDGWLVEAVWGRGKGESLTSDGRGYQQYFGSLT